MQHDQIARVIYFSHGGGPLPLLGDPDHKNMVDFLTSITPTLQVPSAILVVSAHWEEAVATVTSRTNPPLIYDYYGFPEESYLLSYPVPGDPDLAKEVYRLLEKSGIEAKLDPHRGLDHGLFVPLKLMYPDARIPCVQLSLVHHLDPATHIHIGKALASLRTRNILVIGSGFSFHNMQAFFTSRKGEPDPKNGRFQQWLIDTCTNVDLSREERERRLIAWESAPSARYCHPREEHLIPLHVCCGLTGSAATLVFDAEVLGKRSVAFLW